MLLIENGLYFDGRGSAPTAKHVLVKDGVVVQVSATPIAAEGAERIDATGKWVMPGFLDTHTHYDAELLAVDIPWRSSLVASGSQLAYGQNKCGWLPLWTCAKGNITIFGNTVCRKLYFLWYDGSWSVRLDFGTQHRSCR